MHLSVCMGGSVHKTGNRRAVEVPAAAAATTRFSMAYSPLCTLCSQIYLLSRSLPASSFSVRSAAEQEKDLHGMCARVPCECVNASARVFEGCS
jgi:hypothetical protein